MDPIDLKARLGEYHQQLALLEQEDIRIPNQSLIFDFFCIDEELAEFLRLEVFGESASRYKTWVHLNIRDSDLKSKLTVDSLSELIKCRGFNHKRVWISIVRYTAQRQNNIQSLKDLDNLVTTSFSTPPNSTTEQKVLVESDGSKADASDSGKTREKDAHISDLRIKTQPAKSNNQKTDQREPNYLGIVVGSISGALLLSALIASSFNIPTTTNYSNNTSSDDLAGLTKLEDDAKDAVLICELRQIIERANLLSFTDSSLISRKNKVISAANKSISWLDQPSGKGHKYWEDSSCTWGVQWFDKHADNAFRAFIALSRKCDNSVLHYKYTSDKLGKNILATGSIALGSHRQGEIQIPFHSAYSYVFVDKVVCD